MEHIEEWNNGVIPVLALAKSIIVDVDDRTGELLDQITAQYFFPDEAM